MVCLDLERGKKAETRRIEDELPRIAAVSRKTYESGALLCR
jgi:hypothetical protein